MKHPVHSGDQMAWVNFHFMMSLQLEDISSYVVGPELQLS
jgi:hypothetical protein